MKKNKKEEKKNNLIAIVGMACRFPGAIDYREFYKNLENELNFVTPLSEEKWKHYGESNDNEQNISKFCGQLEDPFKFDNDFFRITNREAAMMDPQQRILLEETWHCIEDSGISLEELQNGNTSVFVGATANDNDIYVSADKEKIDKFTCSGNFISILANRVSFAFGLTGESVTLDTACASSLVSLYEAKKSINNGESDFAIAAGVCLAYHPWRYLSFSKAHMMSLTGQCRAFAGNADGFVQGEGVGVLLLRPLDKAIKDKNNIYGIIRGAAVNHCGSNHTLSAPKVESQCEVIDAALKDAELNPKSISYVEAHGTGTIIGDPIEIEALTKCYKKYTDNNGYCKIGSVKTNIGHLASAAGIAGVIKVLLMMKHKKIVKSLFSEYENPMINFAKTPFSLANKTENWISKNGDPLRAGVSAFGFGGVNTHVIIEEYQSKENEIKNAEANTAESTIFALSAKCEESMSAMLSDWKNYISSDEASGYSLHEISDNLLRRKLDMEYRVAFLATDINNLISQIDSELEKNKNAYFKERNWILRIGNIENAAKKLVNNIDNESDFKNRIIKNLGKIRQKTKIVDINLFSESWQQENKELFQFLIITLFIDYMFDRGLKAKAVVAYDEIGNWIGKCVSGIYDIYSSILALKGVIKEEKLKKNQPDCLFIDFKGQVCISENSFSAEYLEWFVQKISKQVVLNDNNKLVEYYKNKYDALLINQISFRNEMIKWENELNPYGLTVKKLIDQLHDKKHINSKENMLLIIIMESALNKLNRKWNLQGENLVKNNYLNEIINLVEKGWFLHNEVVDLFYSNAPKFEEISDSLNNKCVNKKGFECLHQYYIENNKDINTVKMEQTDADELLNDIFSEDNYYYFNIGYNDEKETSVCFDCEVVEPCKKSLIDLWVHSAEIKLIPNENESVYKKLPLPTYHYSGKVYPLIEKKETAKTTSLCPIIDSNISDFKCQKFVKKITNRDFFISEHIVNHKKTMPYAAFVEMAKEAGDLSFGESVSKISELIVERSFIIEDKADKDLYIQLSPYNSGARFVVYSIENNKERLYCKGILSCEELEENISSIDIKEYISDFNNESSIDKYYDFIEKIGIKYGSNFHTIKKFWEKDNMCLSEIELSSEFRKSENKFKLHPTMLDGALQSVIRLIGNTASNVIYLPYATSEISVYKELTDKCYVYAVKRDENSDEAPVDVDIYIYNEFGELCVAINKFTAKAMKLNNYSLRFYEERLTDNEVTEIGVDKNSFKTIVLDSELLGEVADELIRKGFSAEKKKYCSLFNKDEQDKTFYSLKNTSKLCFVISIDTKYSDVIWNLILLIKNAIYGNKFEKILILVVYNKNDKEKAVYSEAFDGFGRTIALENPIIQVRSIGFDSTKPISVELISRSIICEIKSENDRHHNIVYTYDGVLQRRANEYFEFTPEKLDVSCIRKDGTYVIFGGAGGLGTVFLDYFLRKGALNVYLLGRSSLSVEKKNRIDSINKYNKNVQYIQVDITKTDEINAIIDHIYSAHGIINGVLHCAGVLRDSFFWQKKKEEMMMVFEPKISGVQNLFKIFSKKELDFFVLFSSMAAALGSVAQCDYSYSNAYLDSFADIYKEKCPGLVSIQWPLWKDGGMRLSEKDLDNLKNVQGLAEIESEEGFYIFEQAVASNSSHLLALKGEPNRYIKRFDSEATEVKSGESKDGNSDESYEIAKDILIGLVAKEIGVANDEIDPEREFSYYGIDSGMITDLNIEIERIFSEQSKTLFFEYFTINDLAKYLGKKYSGKLSENKNISKENKVSDIENNLDEISRFFDDENIEDDAKEDNNEIAIIGIAGQYPDADDLNEFWSAIENGKDCIKEIPKDRWDNSKYYKEKGNGSGYYCKWGGWIKGVDKFDPMFFHISPREAESMDPQERLFLMNTWHAIEDAGYKKNEIQNAGVFVGVMYGTYCMEAVEETAKGNTATVGLSHSSIANRVSYSLNLNGPSIAIDTMCSSSITAIHLACESLRNRECELAIAGGVNITTHPQKYLYLSKGNFLSSEGKCRSFGEGGDGYVPGEGVGTVILKPLSAAKRDGDHIYGVIRSTSINHGGKTSGFTVPNPRAQEKVIRDSFEKAGISPETIGYIEAHGTGTALGDPIEITALKNAFGDGISKKIPIGSVKSNIGHLESAAGIAAITKVLLQFKYKKIAPSLHSDIINNNIKFDDTPFVVQRSLIDWDTQKIYRDGKYEEIPRRATVSAFGAGGSNAHIILEEYSEKNIESSEGNKKHLFVLSAASEQAVQKIASKLLESDLINSCNIGEIAYTLCRGREELEERVAFVCDSKTKLIKALTSISQGKYEEIFNGNIESQRIKISKAEICSILVERDLQKIAELWVKGAKIDLTELFKDKKYKRISLPTYPFDLQRYYISHSEMKKDERNASISSLLDSNLSDIYGLKYGKTFSSEEFFVEDHIIAGKHLVPGAAFIEMARQAGEKAIKNTVYKMSNIIFADSLEVKTSEETQIIFERNNDLLNYKIVTSKGNRILGRGIVNVIQNTGSSGKININEIVRHMGSRRDSVQIHQLFHTAGFMYGKSMRAMSEAWYDENSAISHLILPECLNNDKKHFGLNPSLLDAALGTVMQISEHSSGIEKGVRVPFSVDEIYIYNDLTENCYCYAELVSKKDNISKYDIDILDESGNILVHIHNFMARLYTQNDVYKNEQEIYYYRTVLKEKNEYHKEGIRGPVMVFGNISSILLAKISRQYNIIQVRFGEKFEVASNTEYIIDPLNESCYRQLFHSILKNGSMPEKILYFDDLNSGLSEVVLDDFINYRVWLIINLIRSLSVINQDNKTKFKYFYIKHEIEVPMQGLISGLANSTQGIDRNFTISCIGISDLYNKDLLSEIILSELSNDSKKEKEIIYINDKRYVKNIEKVEISDNGENDNTLYLENGVYLIIGGLGKIARIVTKAIAENNKAQIILTGRRSLSDEDKQYIDELRDNGSSVEYVICDITSYGATASLIERIKRLYGKIDYVLNCAGNVGKKKALEVDYNEFRHDISSKVLGLYNLDKAIGDMQVGKIVLFSSISGRIGDFGLGTYGAVSRFMDAFAEYRNDLAEKGIRKGKTISVDWPFWAGGGMKLPEDEKKLYYDYGGFTDLEDLDGVRAISEIMHSSLSEVIVACGEKNAIEKVIGISTLNKTHILNNNSNEDQSDLIRKSEDYLKGLFSEVTKYPKEQIKSNKNIENYGMDSVMISEFNERISKDIPNLSSALLFEYVTINQLAVYLVNEHSDNMRSIFGISQSMTENTEKIILSDKEEEKNSIDVAEKGKYKKDDIAIIGISGRFPEAENIDEFWNNLVCGKDCIIEIPSDRWDYRKYYTPERDVPGKIYSKWGGFLKNGKQFDPLFFGISPKDARRMDPQERIFLETVWECIEDAGYSKESLDGKKIGVFVGSMYAAYQMDIWDKNRTEFANSFFSAIANRVSYTMNITGPSLALDTACSSSLEAIRIACSNIWEGTCQSAIAGGVNLSLHPEKYLFLCQNGFLSSDGKCRSFGADGDGYVPGEGVGAVWLKSLKQAEKDNDHIYGVIKAAAVNHGGKTRGYTVPNPRAQENLICDAIAEANIPVDSISYFEMHGTGTSLGDPIEVDSLCNAIKKNNGSNSRYAIGSVKSNIGHLESAAGIASVIKVLLQMKYRKLVPSIHSENLNPGIAFDRLPIYVQRKYEDWISKKNENTSEYYPLRAGISAFGAGGTNVHIILEEYRPKEYESKDGDEIIVMSAKNKNTLKVSAERLIKYLENEMKNECGTDSKNEELSESQIIKLLLDISGIHEGFIDRDTLFDELGFSYVQLFELSEKLKNMFNADMDVIKLSQCNKIANIVDICCNGQLNESGIYSNGRNSSLSDISYTLQVGRTKHEARLAFVVASKREMLNKLKAFISDPKTNEVFAFGIDQSKERYGLYNETDLLFEANEPEKIAYDWCMGKDIDWEKYNNGRNVHRISLPTYPFENKEYVIEPNNSFVPDKEEMIVSEEYSTSSDYSDDDMLLSCMQKFKQNEMSEEEIEEVLEAYLKDGKI